MFLLLQPGQLAVSDGTSTPSISVVTGAVADAGTALATGGQIYDFVTGQGYLTSATDDQTAAEVSVTPTGNLTSTTVQAALEELQGDIDSDDGGTVTSVSSATTSQLTVSNGTTTPSISVVTGAVANSGTALATGDQIYDFVTGQGYLTSETDDQTAAEVTYTNTTSGLSATTVQAAIDELDSAIDSDAGGTVTSVFIGNNFPAYS